MALVFSFLLARSIVAPLLRKALFLQQGAGVGMVARKRRVVLVAVVVAVAAD
jgi:hypothetical protein